MDDGLVLDESSLFTSKMMVLILIVVDNGLVHTCIWSNNVLLCVLILIVVDNGLVHYDGDVAAYATGSLNPYCSGQWSSTPIVATRAVSQGKS